MTEHAWIMLNNMKKISLGLRLRLLFAKTEENDTFKFKRVGDVGYLLE